MQVRLLPDNQAEPSVLTLAALEHVLDYLAVWRLERESHRVLPEGLHAAALPGSDSAGGADPGDTGQRSICNCSILRPVS